MVGLTTTRRAVISRINYYPGTWSGPSQHTGIWLMDALKARLSNRAHGTCLLERRPKARYAAMGIGNKWQSRTFEPRGHS